LKEIAVVLKPFDPVTTEISAEKAITASKIIMLVGRLTTACNKIQPTLRNELATTLLTKLLEDMKKCFSDENNILLAHATFLDRRFKKNGFVTGSGYNNVKDSMTAAISRQLSASSAHTISSAAPEESRSEICLQCQ